MFLILPSRNGTVKIPSFLGASRGAFPGGDWHLCIWQAYSNERVSFLLGRQLTWRVDQMIDINISLFIQIANFLVFLVLMNFILYNPIRRIVAERKKLISDKQKEIEDLEAQARAALLDYDQKLQDARRTGAQKIQELKAAGYEQEKELLHRISDQTTATVHEMREKIQKDMSDARKELKQEVKTFSTDLAQKILGRKI